jgi:predicted transcriptional regulator
VKFREASLLGACLAKDYAEDMFRLLATYKTISSSEAASRLSVHIKTTQDFLEDLFSLGIVSREEVYEGKRPYFRYSLKVERIVMDLDLSGLQMAEEMTDLRLKLKIKELQNAGARFTTARSNDYLSSVVVWAGSGRNRTEKKINLSVPQGRFLFHLPFPSAEPLSIEEIMKKAGVDRNNVPEIVDIVQVLIELKVVQAA